MVSIGLMDKKAAAIARLTNFGVPLITLFIWTQGIYDPVNLPKMVLLSTLAFALLFILGFKNASEFFTRKSFASKLLGIFLILGTFNLFIGGSLFSTSFFGLYGRNTGFLTYLSFSILMITTFHFTQRSNYRHLVLGLLVAGAVNSLYGALQVTDNEFLPWGTQRGTMLGTLGNANFTSAFLGMCIVICVSILFLSNLSLRTRILLVAGILLSLFDIVKSSSIQGLIVALFGSALSVLVLLLKLKIKALFVWTYTIILTLSTILGAIGILGHGPMKSILFSQNMAYRLEYWSAAFNTGRHNLLFGVGWDAFGDFYRRFRGPNSLVSPGVDTTVDSAHNVYLDFFANGGLLMALAYSLLSIAILYSIYIQMKSGKFSDPVFVSISLGWISYQLQSLISINQIGLAVWGWVLGGAVLGYSKIESEPDFSSVKAANKLALKKTVGKNSTVNEFIGVTSFIGAVIGLLIAIPPLLSDANWRNAQESKKYEVLTSAILKWPRDANRMVAGAKIFTLNKYEDEGLKFTLEATRTYPDSFGPWQLLYALPQSTSAQKAEALMEMKRLDPLNPKLKDLP